MYAKMRATLKGRKKLLWLWKKQGGKCPVCQQAITMDTGWHRHHVIHRVKGGPDDEQNLVLLHENCHYQTHALGTSGVRPGPTRGR